ncbi:phenazine biosynthesis protein [Podospora aff. communis PSN243]|uniref:Phenazine biosynthesis protein n=1 Tax=Podospora aff. communis PSN243 TaxID=3040156 RepID=A0AAV9GBH3_9PEZI|nr:phenazine biosynthesis protein [Podospora aff. communis PSN243]
MPTLPFTIIDVFSTTPYKGNPLAIVDARTLPALTDTQMQLITRQFNLSETTFFFPPTLAGADYKLRSFLPYGWEVFGAGHNILGVWWYLAQAGVLDLDKAEKVVKQGKEEFTFWQELGGSVGAVKVLRGVDGKGYEVAIRQARPGAHAEHRDGLALAGVLGLGEGDVGFPLLAGASVYPRVMSTSTTHHLLVPVKSVEALDRAVVQRDKLVEQLDLLDSRAHGIFWFTPVEGKGGVPTFQARFYSRGMTAEDPATGSAAGPLSAYLYKSGVLKLENGKARILVYQGLKIGRECVIEVVLTVSNEGGEEVLDVDIVGSGAEVAKGEISLPDLSTVF